MIVFALLALLVLGVVASVISDDRHERRRTAEIEHRRRAARRQLLTELGGLSHPGQELKEQ